MNENAASVHKQFLLADRLRLHVQDAAKLFGKFVRGGKAQRRFTRFIGRHFGPDWQREFFRDVKSDDVLVVLLFQDTLLYLSLFYALVYSAVEGWQDAGFSDPEVDALLSDDDKLEKLRRFRNAQLHVQKEFISEKTLAFLEERDSETWIRNLHRRLGMALSNHPDIKPYFEPGQSLVAKT